MAVSKPSTYDLTVQEARDYVSPEQGWEDLATACSRQSWRSGGYGRPRRGLEVPGCAGGVGVLVGEVGVAVAVPVAGDCSPEWRSAAELRG